MVIETKCFYARERTCNWGNERCCFISNLYYVDIYIADCAQGCHVRCCNSIEDLGAEESIVVVTDFVI